LNAEAAVLAGLLALAACETEQPPVYPEPTPEEARAIAVAERFIVEQGYTTAIPHPDAIVPGLLQGHLPVSVIWEMRHDTIRPQAYGIAVERQRSFVGWTVFFEYTTSAEGLAGVEVTPDYREAFMSHYEMRLDAPEKVLRPRTKMETPG
jgi:hypothetical protein